MQKWFTGLSLSCRKPRWTALIASAGLLISLSPSLQTIKGSIVVLKGGALPSDLLESPSRVMKTIMHISIAGQ